MKKIVLDFKVNVVLLLVLLFFSVLMHANLEMIDYNYATWQGTPKFIEWTEMKGKTAIKVDCDGKEGKSDDAKIILAYLKNPDMPLPVSILYKDGHFDVAVKK